MPPAVRNEPGLALRCAHVLIRLTCRALPGTERADCASAWAAEAEAAYSDLGIRLSLRRDLNVLWFALSLVLNLPALRRASTRPVRTAWDRAVIVLAAVSVAVPALLGGFLGGAVFQGGTVGWVFGPLGGLIWRLLIQILPMHDHLVVVPGVGLVRDWSRR
jgi:hypothetical protein